MVAFQPYWKLQITYSRRSGFSPSEIILFRIAITGTPCVKRRKSNIKYWTQTGELSSIGSFRLHFYTNLCMSLVEQEHRMINSVVISMNLESKKWQRSKALVILLIFTTKHLQEVAWTESGMDRYICNSCRENQEAEVLCIAKNVKKAQSTTKTAENSSARKMKTCTRWRYSHRGRKTRKVHLLLLWKDTLRQC